MTPQCEWSVVQVVVVIVDIGVVTYEAMTPQCWRSVVQFLVVRVYIRVVIYEAMTPQCGRSVVQFLVVGVNIGVVICEAVIFHSALTFEGMRTQCMRGYLHNRSLFSYYLLVHDIIHGEIMRRVNYDGTRPLSQRYRR